MFSCHLFGAGEIEGYFYGALECLNRTTQNPVRKAYGDGIMSINVEAVPTWAFKVPNTFLNRTGKERSAWTGPTFINVARDLSAIVVFFFKINPRSFNNVCDNERTM